MTQNIISRFSFNTKGVPSDISLPNLMEHFQTQYDIALNPGEERMVVSWSGPRELNRAPSLVIYSLARGDKIRSIRARSVDASTEERIEFKAIEGPYARFSSTRAQYNFEVM